MVYKPWCTHAKCWLAFIGLDIKIYNFFFSPPRDGIDWLWEKDGQINYNNAKVRNVTFWRQKKITFDLSSPAVTHNI
jgi:hypothetical protein